MSDTNIFGKRGLAPAKLNLFLHINGRITHGDFQGYHELQTYFQLLTYGDWVHAEVTQKPEITVEWRAGDESLEHKPPSARDDLIYRAAHLLQQAAIQQGDSPLGARIRLQKNTPVGGGMGGGSSAAATTLRVLNELWALNLPPTDLQQLGVRLGADVPVFITGHNAWAEGMGERITPLPSPTANQWFVIVVPQSTSLTRSLFAHPDLPRNTPKLDYEPLLSHWQTQGGNAFESIVLKESDAILDCFHALRQHTGFARLTGSGACVFSPVISEEAGHQVSSDILNKIKAAKRVIIAKALPNALSIPA